MSFGAKTGTSNGQATAHYEAARNDAVGRGLSAHYVAIQDTEGRDLTSSVPFVKGPETVISAGYFDASPRGNTVAGGPNNSASNFRA